MSDAWTPPAHWARDAEHDTQCKGVAFACYRWGRAGITYASPDGRALVSHSQVYHPWLVSVDGREADTRPRYLSRALELAARELRAADRRKAAEAEKPKRKGRGNV